MVRRTLTSPQSLTLNNIQCSVLLSALSSLVFIHVSRVTFIYTLCQLSDLFFCLQVEKSLTFADDTDAVMFSVTEWRSLQFSLFFFHRSDHEQTALQQPRPHYI